MNFSKEALYILGHENVATALHQALEARPFTLKSIQSIHRYLMPYSFSLAPWSASDLGNAGGTGKFSYFPLTHSA